MEYKLRKVKFPKALEKIPVITVSYLCCSSSFVSTVLKEYG